MKLLVLAITIFIVSICKAEPNVTVYTEQSTNGYAVYADNNEFIPISVEVNFESLLNLSVDAQNPNIYVLKPQQNRQLLTHLTIQNKFAEHQYKYSYLVNYGDLTDKKYDKNYRYNLPYPKSKAYLLTQGYNGNHSHQNLNALDFRMPTGSKILAIRGGVVVRVIENNSKGCNNKSCADDANLILIYHADGSFAEYLHLKQNGAVVSVGDKVSSGQLIGYSGNTGWSSEPHLHLSISLPHVNGLETIKTKFRIGNGSQAVYLQQDKRYRKDY